MPPAQHDGDGILRVAADALHLVEGAAGDHEGELAAALLNPLPPDGEPESIHRHHGEAAAADLKESAGMDRTSLVGRDGKGALLDHLPKDLLLQDHKVLVLDLREVGVVLRAETGDIEGSVPAAQMYGSLAVGGEGDDVIRHPADDVAKEAGVQD